MAGIFNSGIFNNAIFNVGAVDPDAPPSGGKGDNPAARRRVSVKPTGLIARPKKARKDVQDRIDESREIHAEVQEQAFREFAEETIRLKAQPETVPVEAMSLREIDAEIGALLRKKLRTEEEELMLLILMAAAA